MDKIVVRCPKCRYRFDVQVLKGFNVVQCACPRCGAPFDYDLSEVYKNGGFVEKNVPGCGAMSSDETGKIGCDAIQENRQEQGIESLESHEEAKAATASESDAIPVATVPQSMLPGKGVATPMRKVKRRKHRLLWLAVLLFLFVFLANQGTRSNDDTWQLSMPSLSNSKDSSEESNADVADYGIHVSREIPPQWLQGTWTVSTDYGVVKLVIQGNCITETVDGLASHGTFYYQQQRLYCDFGDGETFVYRLDMREHRVDAGENVLMKKVR